MINKGYCEPDREYKICPGCYDKHMCLFFDPYGHYEGLIETNKMTQSQSIETDLLMVELETTDIRSRDSPESVVKKVCQVFAKLNEDIDNLEKVSPTLSTWNPEPCRKFLDQAQDLLCTIVKLKSFVQKLPEHFLDGCPPDCFLHRIIVQTLIDETFNTEVEVDLLAYLSIKVYGTGCLSEICSRLEKITKSVRVYGLQLRSELTGKKFFSSISLLTASELLSLEDLSDTKTIDASIQNLGPTITVKNVTVSSVSVENLLTKMVNNGKVKCIDFQNCILNFDACFALIPFLTNNRSVRVTFNDCSLSYQIKTSLEGLYYQVTIGANNKWL